MNKRQERQQNIIKFIQIKAEVSNSEILDFLGDTIERTTLQRDLIFLQKKGYIIKSGSGRGTVYSLSEINKISLPIKVEEYFSVPYFQRKTKEKFNFEIFNILRGDIFTAEEMSKLEKLQLEFSQNFARYKSKTLINREYERIMIEFSWKSSEIEGNTYSLLSTEALIKNNVVGKGNTSDETQMILNHKDAFNEAVNNRERFINLRVCDIEYIHSVLTKNLRIGRNIRREGVSITGTNYKPLDNEAQVKEALQDMVNLINNKKSFFEKAFLVSILIAYIQVFEDGNKRTSRMISNAVLLANNSIPLSYRIIDVEEYKKAAILFYELNNVSYFKEIFINQFEDAVNNYFK